MGVCNVSGSCHMQYFNIQRHGNRAPSLPWQLLQPKVYPLYHIVITWLACYTRHSKIQVRCVNWATFITTVTLYMGSVSNLIVCHLKLSNGLRCLPIFVNKCPQTSLYVTKWNKFSWTADSSRLQSMSLQYSPPEPNFEIISLNQSFQYPQWFMFSILVCTIIVTPSYEVCRY